MPGDEFASRPPRGRVYAGTARLRLDDVGRNGRIRLDAIARLIQDVAADDVAETDQAAGLAWVVRRTEIEFTGKRQPRYADDVALATWCSGTGARWAERRTDVHFGTDAFVRTRALWVLVDLASGRPVPLPTGFAEVYAEAAGGRRVGQRLQHGPPPARTARAPWPLRVTDLDVLGHVNNANYWAPVEELLDGRRVARAELEFRGGLDRGDAVDLHSLDDGRDLRLWLTVGGEVRASAVAVLAGSGEGSSRSS